MDIKLRVYESSDAKTIVSWINNEDVFIKWGGNRFGNFPICSDDINKKYYNDNGGCKKKEHFYPWIALDDNDRIIGHFIMKYLDGNSKTLRFGWVIVDDLIR